MRLCITWLAVVAAGVILSGCGGAAGTASSASTPAKATTAGSAVPTTMGARSTALTTSSSSAPLRRCTSGQLHISFFGTGAATGTGLIGIDVGIVNSPRKPCWLDGAPKVELIGEDGSAIVTSGYDGQFPPAVGRSWTARRRCRRR